MKIFSNPRFKHNINWVVMIAAVIAIAVVINVLLGALLERYPLEIELVPNGALALTEETKDMLHKLDKDINITVFKKQNESLQYVDEIIERYLRETGKIKIIEVDPDQNPALVNKYATINDTIFSGTLAVEHENKKKLLSAASMFPIDRQGKRGASINAEGMLTSAIMYVTRDKNINVGFITGHGEHDMTSGSYASLMKDENIDFDSLSLLNGDVPEDVDTLIIAGAKTDFSQLEIERLDRYLSKGKTVQVLCALEGKSMPRLDMFLAEWGIKINQNVVMETDPSMVMTGSDMMNIANIVPSEITESIITQETPLVIPAPRSLTALWKDQYEIQVSEILTSSEKAIVKADDINSGAENDVTGRFNVALLAARQGYEGAKTFANGKIFVIGTSMVYYDALISYNSTLFLNSIAVLSESEDSIIIKPKSLMPTELSIQKSTAIVCSILVIGIIPLVVILCGLIVWLRRRHL